MSEEHTTDHEKKHRIASLLAKLRIVVLILAAALIVFLVTKNWDSANVDLILIKSEMPVAILIILTFLFGVGVGVLLAFLRPWKKKRS